MNVRAKVSSKGQVVIPKAIRDRLGIVEGSEVEFVEAAGGLSLKPVRPWDERYPPITVEEFLKRRIKLDRPFPTEAEIEETLLDEAARRFDATRR